MEPLYFDHNATTPLCPEARQAWLEAVDCHWLNPSSPYRAAAAVHARLEAARDALGMLCGVDSRQIIFTSGATEANNAIFRHWAECLARGARVGVSAVEHPSVLEAAEAYFGDRVVCLSVDTDGRLDLAALKARLASGELAAVSVMAANNETGVLQPWQEVAELCRAGGVAYHCDASQWFGRMPTDGLGGGFYVSGCAHKFGGPKRVGFLLTPCSDEALRLGYGGGQESGRRPGTEDVAGVLAMVAALRAAEPSSVTARDHFVGEILRQVGGVRILAEKADRLWNTVALVMPEFTSVRWVRALEKAGGLLSSGSACATGSGSVSHVLLAMGIEPTEASRVLRISSGFSTTSADWKRLLAAFTAAYARLRAEADAGSSPVIQID